MPRAIAPPASSAMSSVARAEATTSASMSAPRSKRYAASVRRPSAREVRRIETGWNQALSSRTRVVLSVTSVSAPPITPARPTARRGSAITSIESSRTRSCPSRVVKRSPFPARRTTIVASLTVSQSKAWSGWPSSQRT